MSDTNSNRRPRAWLWSSIAVLAFTLTGLLLSYSEPKAITDSKPGVLPVTVIELAPQSRQLTVKATGITEPHWTTAIVATVGGRVAELSSSLEPGALVSSGELMVRLESESYQAEVDAAISRVATAKLELERMKHEQTVALKINVGQQRPSFARREPHVEAAAAELNAARSALAAAQQRLQNTRVQAPFAAIVLQRQVTPGQWVQAGEQLFQVASSAAVNVRVELPEQSWRRLGAVQPGTEATVIDENKTQWQARVRYLNPTRNRITRQRGLVLEVVNPYQSKQPLLPDQQVDIVFAGNSLAQVFDAPASVLTEDGMVWTVDSRDQLKLERVEVLQEGIEWAWIRFSQAPEQPRRLVRYPLGIMLSGQQVEPKAEAENVAGSVKRAEP